MKSLICDVIEQNPNNWEQELSELNIKIKKCSDLPYAIFNYDINADFSNPVVQEARGIIIDIEKLEVVCWPFRKFGNYTEFYADEIDWTTAHVQEKVDGSIIKLWYSDRLNDWVWSTNSCIFASEANTQNGRSFMSIIKSTSDYQYLQHVQQVNVSRNHRFFLLNRLFTYIFELVSPDNQVVLKYPEARLYHLGTRNNLTGEEISNSIGIQRPKEYPLHSLSDCEKAVENLNTDTFPDAEGFVVVDANWHRIKIKSPEYLIWHHKVNNGIINAETAYELLKSDDFDWDVFRKNASDYMLERLEHYNKLFIEVNAAIIALIHKARDLQAKGLSRKEIALQIKSSPYSFYGFKGLDYTQSPEDLINSLGVKAFIKVVERNEQ